MQSSWPIFRIWRGMKSTPNKKEWAEKSVRDYSHRKTTGGSSGKSKISTKFKFSESKKKILCGRNHNFHIAGLAADENNALGNYCAKKTATLLLLLLLFLAHVRSCIVSLSIPIRQFFLPSFIKWIHLLGARNAKAAPLVVYLCLFNFGLIALQCSRMHPMKCALETIISLMLSFPFLCLAQRALQKAFILWVLWELLDYPSWIHHG